MPRQYPWQRPSQAKTQNSEIYSLDGVDSDGSDNVNDQDDDSNGQSSSDVQNSTQSQDQNNDVAPQTVQTDEFTSLNKNEIMSLDKDSKVYQIAKQRLENGESKWKVQDELSKAMYKVKGGSVIKKNAYKSWAGNLLWRIIKENPKLKSSIEVSNAVDPSDIDSF